jgi:hypothetical protein
MEIFLLSQDLVCMMLLVRIIMMHGNVNLS